MRDTADSPLTAALIGCGRMGAHTDDRVRRSLPPGWLPLNHAEAIRACDGLRLTAVCDVETERAQATARMLDVECWYTDYEAMIREVRPDVVAVATRTKSRTQIIEFAADHGVKGLHVEKPLSFNMRDCRRAMNATERNGCKLSYGATRRYMDIYRRAKVVVDSGLIGDAVQISIEFGHTMLLWNHPHSADLLLFFAGDTDIDYVQARCTIPPPSVLANCIDADPLLEFGFVKFKNGVNGLVSSASGMNVRIAGNAGSLVVSEDGRSLDIYRGAEKSPYENACERIALEPEMSGTHRAFRELTEAVRNQQQGPIRPEEVIAAQQLLFAFAASSLQEGKWISPHDVDDAMTITGRTGDLYP